MSELLKPDAEVYLLEKKSEGRKTSFNLVLVKHRKFLVSIDSNVPNKVMLESIDKGLVPEFEGFKIKKREPKISNSRLDFLLQGEDGLLFLEVKSCTLVLNGVGFFPDAPTTRGSKHLRILMDLLSKGRAVISFLIQRPDAYSLRPNDLTDPIFAEVFREAVGVGVEVYAYNCLVNFKGVSLLNRVAIEY
jgi:sugar fermentation stimulation protein A